MTLDSVVLGRLRAVPALSGRRWHAEDLTGGLTNHNLKVTLEPDGDHAASEVYVARLAHPEGAMLAIDRDAEYAASVAAASTGVAPPVVDRLAEPGGGVLLIGWVTGRTYGPEDLRVDANLVKVVRALKTLHAGPRFPVDFDMFDIQQGYLDVVRRNGFRLPERYLEFAPLVDRMRAAMRATPIDTVPCHNDLLAANLIDDGEKVWVIDYEYAGNNDACFELGNLWSESTLDPPVLERLVELYYGHASRQLVARARLWALMSKYGWMLWAAIQDGVSGLDFDFWSWGLEKYDRAVAEFDGPDLARWLEEVRTAA